jgi:hypothetical protein
MIMAVLKWPGRSPKPGCAEYWDKILGKIGDVNFLIPVFSRGLTGARGGDDTAL